MIQDNITSGIPIYCGSLFTVRGQLLYHYLDVQMAPVLFRSVERIFQCLSVKYRIFPLIPGLNPHTQSRLKLNNINVNYML